ncbi:MAG TPA: hypothetical protein DEF12_07535, partial [Rhodobacteraceae bacterium]|nr:hypothetical protein [Paracoccaceae bacterium]
FDSHRPLQPRFPCLEAFRTMRYAAWEREHSMSFAHIFATLTVIAVGASGGYFAAFLGTPMPFLLGSLLAGGLFAFFFGARLPEDY